MASDRDRLSYDAKQQYRSVVAQQGRVMVPADFNEMQEIAGEELREEALDFVGPTGTPDDGYRISIPHPHKQPDFPSKQPEPFSFSDFMINPGTMYVGGIRACLPASVSYINQSDWLDSAKVKGPILEGMELGLKPEDQGTGEGTGKGAGEVKRQNSGPGVHRAEPARV